jgi:hypothetical protein
MKSFAELGVHLFPVRHHSPRAAACLNALLEAVQPQLILIEGPSDADHLIPLISASDTEPPIAILAYATKPTPQSSLWPFARYSPEYEALRWAAQHQVPARFIDRTATSVLQESAEAEKKARELQQSRASAEVENEVEVRVEAEIKTELVGDAEPARPHPNDQLAEHFQLRSFNEFWDTYFETPNFDAASYQTALRSYAELLTTEDAALDPRDGLMAHAIYHAIEQTPPERIVVVLGAMHVAKLLAGQFDLAQATEVQAQTTHATQAMLTLIPYSYARLSEQSGYGAGNRAPWFYERAFAADLDYQQATLRVLLEFSADLRLRGFAVSLADVIEAYRMSGTLAAIRQKSGPGLDEIADSARATLTRGEQEPITRFLMPLLIGNRIGRISQRAGQNSLQREFDDSLKHFGFEKSDDSQTVTLRLTDPKHGLASEFLHRLRGADIPYAGFAGSQSVVAASRNAKESAGGFAALQRVREHWDIQWTPATEIALIERVIYGEHLLEVCDRRLQESLITCSKVCLAADVLIDAALTQTPQALMQALDETERLSASDDDVPSLAAAARTLSGLVSYGHTRTAVSNLEATILRLLSGTYERAILRLPAACKGTAADTKPVRESMLVLHDLALSQSQLSKEAWFNTLEELMHNTVHEPTCCGTAAALISLAGALPQAQLLAVLEPRLSNAFDPAAACAFIEGFFAVNALVLLKNAEVVRVLSAFVTSLDLEVFRNALPALRRAFAELGASERRYLIDHLVKQHAPSDKAVAATVITTKETEQLKDLGATLDAALGDLSDLL